MSYQLRDYQSDAVDTVINHIRKNTTSCLLKLPTGAGKSLIVAELAKILVNLSGKKVLCLAPNAELCEQNFEKYRLTGNYASFFSASIGKKSLKHDVVFGTPLTVLNAIKKDDRFDSRFAAIIIDEAHNTSATIREIIKRMRTHNPNIRLIGMSATPYRMADGYIYTHKQDEKGKLKAMPQGSYYEGEKESRKPLYDVLTYDLSEWFLIDNGYLTRPEFGKISNHYDTSELKLTSTGKFKQDGVDQAFKGKGRLTSEIVADVVEKSKDRLGVMFFASSIAHAAEVMESLPPEHSAMITGKTDSKERAKTIAGFKGGDIFYLVNVDVLTTGFDAPNCDTIAILRATESAGLLIQIIGRGLRLHDEKAECLVLDYAENVERHAPDGDIFSPDVSVFKDKEPGGIIFKCPSCEGDNLFGVQDDFIDFPHDVYGFAIDPFGTHLKKDTGDLIPVHYGQRCQNAYKTSSEIIQCSFRWQKKTCEECGAENSLSARLCSNCNHELIDPNKKLTKETSGGSNVNPEEWQEVDLVGAVFKPTNLKGNTQVLLRIRRDEAVRQIMVIINWNHPSPFFKMKSIQQLKVITGEDDNEQLIVTLENPDRGNTLLPISHTIEQRKKGDFYEIRSTERAL